MESVHQRLGLQATVKDLKDLGTEEISQYVPYEDESQFVDTFPISDEELEELWCQRPSGA